MISNILIWLVLALPTIEEATSDIINHRKGKRDKKALDVWIRGFLIIVASCVAYKLGAPSVWQASILGTGIFIFFFDYIMGYLLTKRLTFLGTTSKSDSFLKKIPWQITLIGRGLLFVGSILQYYLI